jgi:hypothetical protein
MVQRKAKPKRRKSRAVSALNLLESYTYAHILSEGLAGTSPIGMITGDTDLSSRQQLTSYSGGQFNYSTVVSGAGEISLGDIISQPGLAVATLQSNFMNNYQTMAVQAFGTRLAFKFGKRLLRQPIANINRNIMKPLGVGIKL